MKFNNYVGQELMEGEFSTSFRSKKSIRKFTEKVFTDKTPKGDTQSVFHPLEIHNINGKTVDSVLSGTIKNLFIEKDKEIIDLRLDVLELKN